MLLIGAAAVSFPALAQTTEPAGDETPPAKQPAPAPTDSAQPAPADTPTDTAQPADDADDGHPADRTSTDGDKPDEPAPDPNGGA